MARKPKLVTKMSIALVTLLMGKGVVTAYDYTKGEFIGTSKNIEQVKNFEKEHNRIMQQVNKNLSKDDMALYKVLLREYNRKLVDIGYGMKRSVFKKLDLIDLKSLPVSRKGSLTEMPTFTIISDKEYADYVNSIFSENLSEDMILDNALCLLIPPFTEFGFCFTPNRYGYVKVNGIDMVEHTMDITVQDYTVNKVLSLWVPGTKCNARITLSHNRPASLFDMDSYVAEINTSDAVDPHMINHIISADDLGWNEREKRIWYYMDEMYSKPTMDALAENVRSSYVELVRYLLLAITISNYMLYGNKPVIQREPKEKKSSVPVKDNVSVDQTPLPERRTRTVGMITIKSVKPPKRATPNTVRHWKVASWKARGGVRHMSDGRVIPFKESIRHRKALAGKDVPKDILPVTLKMKDNRPDN